VTVPVLWDTKEETIVNNESREIIRGCTDGLDERITDGIDGELSLSAAVSRRRDSVATVGG